MKLVNICSNTNFLLSVVVSQFCKLVILEAWNRGREETCELVILEAWNRRIEETCECLSLKLFQNKFKNEQASRVPKMTY